MVKLKLLSPDLDEPEDTKNKDNVIEKEIEMEKESAVEAVGIDMLGLAGNGELGWELAVRKVWKETSDVSEFFLLFDFTVSRCVIRCLSFVMFNRCAVVYNNQSYSRNVRNWKLFIDEMRVPIPKCVLGLGREVRESGELIPPDDVHFIV